MNRFHPLSIAIVSLLTVSLVSSAAESEKTDAADENLSDETVIFLAPNGPVFMRVRTVVDGEDFRTWLGEFFFKSLDGNKDGELNSAEWSKMPEGILSIDGFESIDELMKLGDTDPEDGKLSPGEFTAFVRDRMTNSFGITTPAQRRTLIVQLLQKLDVDQDGLMSPEELAAGSDTLSKRDYDDDGTFSATELLPFRDPRFENTDPNLASTELPFVRMQRGTSGSEIADRILARYAANTRAIDRSRIDIDDEAFSRYDHDADGSLARNELASLIADPRHQLELTLHLPTKPRGKIGLSARRLHSRRDYRIDRDNDDPRRVSMKLDGLTLALRIMHQFRSDAYVSRQMLSLNFYQADADKNKYLDESELPAARVGGTLEAIDANGDGMVQRDELMEYAQRQSLTDRMRLILSVERSGESLFETLDANRDRRLTSREFMTGFDQVRKYDQNNDGHIAAREFETHFRLTFQLGKVPDGTMPIGQRNMSTDAIIPEVEGLSGPEWFRRMDRNRDGDVSAREFLGGPEKFASIDEDGDRLISRNEAEAVTPRDTSE